MTLFPPIPDPLEAYAAQFDDLFSRANQRDGFRQYLAGLLLPARTQQDADRPGQRGTGGRGAAPGGAAPAMVPVRVDLGRRRGHGPAAGAAARPMPPPRPMPVGCSSSTRRATARTGPRRRMWGGSTWATGARRSKGWSRWAASGPTRGSTIPLAVEPYTPQHWFALGKADPAFRTKPADRAGPGRPGAGAGLALPGGGGR